MDNIQPIVQILTELPLVHGRQQIAVGRGENAHVHFLFLRASHPADFALLNDAEQTGLHLQA